MTEEEAKTKWCPMARTGLSAGSGGAAVNRSVAGNMRDTPFSVYYETRCLGSGCMMWAWSHTDRVPDGQDGGEPVTNHPDLLPYHAPQTRVIRHGGCGLKHRGPNE